MSEKIVNCDIIYNFAIIIELEGEKIEWPRVTKC